MKKIKNIFSAILMCFVLLFVFNIFAFANDEFDYSGLIYNSSYDYWRTDDKFSTVEEAYVDLGNWLNEKYSKASFNNATCIYDNGKYSFIIYDDDIDRIVNENDYMEHWLQANMPDIVPAGTDGITALRLINDWIYNNMEYEVNLPTSNFAITGLTTRKFSCLGFANLFTMMVEYVPFNCNTGLSDYSNTMDCWHFDSKIVVGNGHAWNAIYINGCWYYFDTTFNETKTDPSTYFLKTTEEFYDGIKYGTVDGDWIRPYIDPSLFIG